MAPFKSTGGLSVGKLLGVFRNRDLTLNSSVRTDRTIKLSATGGDSVFTDGGYKFHVFTTEGPSSFVVTESSGTIHYLVVAGGGSGGPGGAYGGGGGGAGGLITGTLPVAPGTYDIQVGYGGATPGSGSLNIQNNGNPSYLTPSLTAYGGGAGGAGQGSAGSRPGIPGGSAGGGGGGSPTSPGGTGSRITTTSTPTPITPQGNNGEPGVSDNYGGPGGGAGAAGNPPGNVGGVGVAVPWVPPSYGTPGPTPGRWFAGGGSSGFPASVDRSAGGGGGSPDALHDALTNTGGGGGGAYTSGPWSSRLGHGGPGIVIIRYPF